jgi:predicted nuclease of restriction endonuclease-like (RecB) superfamily
MWMMSKVISGNLPEGYTQWLKEVKERIRSAQQKAVLAANSEMILLYWQMGRDILERQVMQGWGTKVIDRLADDLRREFPGMKGFSSRNLKYMRLFSEAWPDSEFVQQVVAQLPWGQNLQLLTKLKKRDAREWYARAAIEHGWSRNVLAYQIDTGLINRQGKAVFSKQLPSHDSELLQQTFKDPYLFDFLNVGEEAQERAIETALVDHITRFLLELGTGFAYVGRQVHFELEGEDFYIDLLFYHLKLRCYVVLELKAGAFKPEYAGKLNFYLSAVDALMKHDNDNPSIGLILCKDKKKFVAEYALKDMTKPVGVSEFRLSEAVPEDFKGSLPTIEELEAELSADEDQND